MALDEMNSKLEELSEDEISEVVGGVSRDMNRGKKLDQTRGPLGNETRGPLGAGIRSDAVRGGMNRVGRSVGDLRSNDSIRGVRKDLRAKDELK